MKVVITGATKGIGRAIALKFAKEGHHIAICARSSKLLLSFEDELKKNYPNIQIISEVADVSKKEDVNNFANRILEKWDSIDILVNNAGVFIPGSIKDEDEKNLPFMIETNLYSAYYLTKRLINAMLKSDKSHIFNICSIASFQAYPNGGSYSISKFALLGFSKCLREELKPLGIKVTHVMPGATLTDSWKGTKLPPERFIPTEDIATLIYTQTQLNPSTVIEDLIIRPQLGDI
ncbi:MAG: SDR family oxidoreductase [Chitinophagales bacterium]|nr:SDR family oxidoreductase [Chitinophagales bacterium]MCZ2392664.1 SDR family oxidoreductase [Chitinophagales bacterium]